MATWIGCEYGTENGATGYLVETLNTSTGRTTWSLRERPLHTNQSGVARLSGWCGETDNKSRYAHGVAKIRKLNKTGDRAQAVRLGGADLATFLADDGHPDLMPAALRAAWNKGEEGGAEDVNNVLAEQGADVVIATLAPGHLAWDEGAINAGAHKIDGVADEHAVVYYVAYARAARERAEEIRAERPAA